MTLVLFKKIRPILGVFMVQNWPKRGVIPAKTGVFQHLSYHFDLDIALNDRLAY